MNYNKYKRPILNPIKIIVTDKMKRTIVETDKYWKKLKLNEIWKQKNLNG